MEYNYLLLLDNLCFNCGNMDAKPLLLGAFDAFVSGLGFLCEIVELINTEDEQNYLNPIISLSSSVTFPSLPQTSILIPKEILSGVDLSFATSYSSCPVEIIGKSSNWSAISNVYDDIID